MCSFLTLLISRDCDDDNDDLIYLSLAIEGLGFRCRISAILGCVFPTLERKKKPVKNQRGKSVMLRPPKNTVTSSDVAASKEHSHIK
jgi:hypothetical protein